MDNSNPKRKSKGWQSNIIPMFSHEKMSGFNRMHAVRSDRGSVIFLGTGFSLSQEGEGPRHQHLQNSSRNCH